VLTLQNVRPSDTAQAGRVLDFLERNWDAGVRRRPDEAMQAAFQTGLVLVAERDGDIVGVSFVYKFPCGTPLHVFAEIGTMRVILPKRGLQTFLARFHIIHAVIEESWPSDPTCFAVVSPGTPSEHNLTENVGMRPWNPPPELKDARAASGSPFKPDKPVIYADPTAVGSAFLEMRNAHRGGRIFALPRGEEEIEVLVGGFDETWLHVK